MKNKNYVISAFIVLLIVAGYYFITRSDKDKSLSIDSSEKMMNSQPGTETEKKNMSTKMAVEPGKMDGAQRYAHYTDSFYENSKDIKRVLFFYANWCPTCKQANDELTSLVNDIPKNVAILRVNYNDTDTDSTEKELAKKYSITYQHTFVLIDKEGNELKKWNGGGLVQIINNTK